MASFLQASGADGKEEIAIVEEAARRSCGLAAQPHDNETEW